MNNIIETRREYIEISILHCNEMIDKYYNLIELERDEEIIILLNELLVIWQYKKQSFRGLL